MPSSASWYAWVLLARMSVWVMLTLESPPAPDRYASSGRVRFRAARPRRVYGWAGHYRGQLPDIPQWTDYTAISGLAIRLIFSPASGQNMPMIYFGHVKCDGYEDGAGGSLHPRHRHASTR
ncbi:hypothetical protein GCM10028775_06070 [Catellatospora paridis]